VGYTNKVHVLVNMAINFGNGVEVFKRFNGAVDKYLQIPLNFIGYITDDISVRDSVRYQCPVVLYRPDSLASRCFCNIEKGLATQLKNTTRTVSFSHFWKDLLTTEVEANEQPTSAPEFNSDADEDHSDEDKRQHALNFFSSLELPDQDKLAIILAQIDNLLNAQNEKTIDANARDQLLVTIANLQKLANYDQHTVTKLTSMATSLTTTGSRLEQQLDQLNNTLEEILSQSLEDWPRQ